MSDELNFAHEILQGREWKEITDAEVLTESERILTGWMSGELRMQRPKLYDHYALLLLALTRENRQLRERLERLEVALNERSKD